MRKTGVLFIGAYGYIATAVMAGTVAMKRGLTERTGMVTELEAFSGMGLIEPEELVFGGWDIREGSPCECARRFLQGVSLPHDLLPAIEEGLRPFGGNFYEGVATNCGRAIEVLSRLDGREHTLQEQLRKLRGDINAFRDRNSLDTVVVFNLASTEPPLELLPCHWTPAGLEDCISRDRREDLRASTLYAYAAILEGCPYVNFTPSNGGLTPALVKLAAKTGVPVMGNDGKTGETLVKSALLPMFSLRNLEVLSWEGFHPRQHGRHGP